MTEYAFQSDLLDAIKTRWQTVPDQQFELPEERILRKLPPGTIVLDAFSGSEYLCDQWGLRHQSVFSVCHKCEQAIGLIVSLDGEVNAVKADDGRLIYWDGILD